MSGEERGPFPPGERGTGITLGVEEEFLLVDPVSRTPVPRAAAVLARVAADPPLPGVLFQPELCSSQVEVASGVCTRLDRLRDQLVAARARLAAAAREEGVRLVAVGNPVLAGVDPPFSPQERYRRIGELFAGTAAGYQACGCHVHVGVADRETAVAVVNRLRPWLPTLLAISANSPFDRGRDTGYGSWRMVLQSRLPGAGVPPRFGSAAEYRAHLHRMVECGTLVDERMSFWSARLSEHLPTVELRVADVATTPDETVLLAGLGRALVRTALADLALGRPEPVLAEGAVAAALWSAARYGLCGDGVDPVAGRRVPALLLVRRLVERVRPALAELGDLAEVERLLDRVVRGSGGARRQRAVAHAGGVTAVVDDLVARTAAG